MLVQAIVTDDEYVYIMKEFGSSVYKSGVEGRGWGTLT